MIDEQARQIEHPRHPRDDGDDVQGFEPYIGIAVILPRDPVVKRSGRAGPPRTRATNCSTCAIGVSGSTP